MNASKVRRWDRFNERWVYECPSGYSEVGEGCSRTVTTASIWVCSSGWSLSGSTCYKTVTAQPVAVTRYSCSSGRLSGTDCVLTAAAVTTTRYECASGTLSGTVCRTTTTVGATSTTVYYCGNRPSSSSTCVVSQYRLTSPDPPTATTTTTAPATTTTTTAAPTTTTVPTTTTTAPATTTTVAPATTTTTLPVYGCTAALGSLGSVEVTRQGTWSSSGGCESSQRGNAQTPHYARFFTFELGADAEVTIDLSSSVDTYLYVLSGHGTAGERLHRNDDADSSTYDSRLSVEMDAGTYTIEATTYRARRGGSFTLTVATDLPAVAAADVTGLAARHDATVGERFDAGFGYTPDTAALSVQSVTPAGLDLFLTHSAGRASLSGTPTRAGTYTAVVALTQTGRVDTRSITVEAACPEGRTRQSDRSCQVPAECAAASWGTLGLDNRTVATAASWAATDCTSKNRPARRHAKYYSFTLDAAHRVAIDLNSQHDTYLYLIEGRDTRRGYLHRNDDIDWPSNANSRILERLPAGTYTVEATTYRANRTGSFKVQARIVAAPAITGLAATHDVTAGEPFSTAFSYRPAAAQLTTTVHPATLDATVTDDAGEVTITATPQFAGTHTITLKLAQPGRTDTRTITINTTCPTGQAPAVDGSGTCTPTATVPAGCAVTALDSRGRSWWGHAWPLVDFAALVPSGLEVCTSLSGESKAVYYSFTVPEGAPSVQTGRMNLAARTEAPILRRLSLQDGGAPMVALWKHTGASPAEVVFVARKTTTASSAPGFDVDLPAGRYLIEIAATETSSQAARNPPAYFYLNAWFPLPETVHKQVQRLGNTGLGGAGMTLEGFLDARGSICYVESSACSTNSSDPFDPPSAAYPWLPFITDECSIPQGLVQGIETWLNAMILEHSSPFTTPELVDLAQYIRDHPTFGTQTVSFVFACMRHDFNWRNLYRVEHHLRHGDAWNDTSRQQADDRFNLDLKRLCDANRGRAPVTHRHYSWTVTSANIDKCHEVADAMKFGVQTYPMSRISYGDEDV